MHSSAHGLNRPAGIGFVPRSRFHHGRFGRLFRNLDPASYGDTRSQNEEAMTALAKTMVDPLEPSESGGGGGWRSSPPDPEKGDNPGT